MGVILKRRIMVCRVSVKVEVIALLALLPWALWMAFTITCNPLLLNLVFFKALFASYAASHGFIYSALTVPSSMLKRGCFAVLLIAITSVLYRNNRYVNKGAFIS